MAAKYHFWEVQKGFVGLVTLLSLIAASFMALQQVCLNNASNAFVEHYCLSDSNMRTVIAFYLTAFSTLLAFMVSQAFNAFRVSRLEHGINEGVYIALATSAPWAYKKKAEIGRHVGRPALGGDRLAPATPSPADRDKSLHIHQ